MFSIFLVREILEVRRQNSFIDSVTHELKSPLASLKLCLETLPKDGIAPNEKEQLRQMMIADVERLSSFVDDILAVSRLTHGQFQHMLSEVPLNPLLSRCVAGVLSRHHLPKEAIQVLIPQTITLRTDRTALETIVKNLLDNAVKYSLEPVSVLISASFQGQQTIILEVQDHGIGIDPKHINRVFERFYRVPTEDVRKRRGTGLGLFVGSALARGLGGRLDAISEGIGKGTKMRLHLPLAGSRIEERSQ